MCIRDRCRCGLCGRTHHTHHELTLAAIAAGKPVVVEKPLALNANQAREIDAAASAAGVIVLEALWSCVLYPSSWV